MIQNINLFSALPPRPKQYLSPKWLLFIIASFTILLILIYGLSYIPLIKEKALLMQLYATKENLNMQINTLEQIKSTTALKKDSLKTKISQFSTYFEALAKATPDGIWLTNIQFLNIDRSLSLSGYAINFEIIPQFFKNLSEIVDFPKGNVSALNLSRVEKGEETGSISFQFGRVSNVEI